MIFIRLWNYFVGYLVIRVKGLSLEKFINLTVSKGIYLWGMDRESYTSLKACISIKGFKKLRKIVRKLHCQIKIVEKRGLPFKTYKYKHRKMLIAGMLVFLVIIYGLSAFIWTVDLEGTEDVKPDLILSKLYESGVKPGAFKGKINTEQIENQLLITTPELSWASLEIRGSRAILRVKEAVEAPDFVKREGPANILAKKDGIIDSMIVLEGEAVVEIGQTVRKGQLLVSGIIEHPDTIGIRYVRAMGRVMARTWYEAQETARLDEVYRVRTGRTIEQKYFGLGKASLPYKKEEMTFKEYDLVSKKEGLVRIDTYYEVELKAWPDNLEEAKKYIEKSTEERLMQEIAKGAKVVDKKLKYDIIEGEQITGVLYLELIEDIGIQEDLTIQ